MTVISNNNIAHAIYSGSLDKTGHDLHLYLQKVVQFLARRRLLLKSKEILESLSKIINQKEGRIIAQIFSVEKLEHKTKTNLTHLLKKRYKAQEIILEEKLNEKLLGGFRIEVGDEVIDLSVRNRIEKLKAYLIRPA